MNDNELERRALELDAMLDGRSADLHSEDKQLVNALTSLAQQIQPEAEFSRKLGYQLAKAVGKQPLQKPTLRYLFARQTLLGLAGALGILAYALFFAPRFTPQNQPGLVKVMTPDVTVAGQTAQPAETNWLQLPLLPLFGPSTVQAGVSLGEMFPKADWTLKAVLPDNPSEAFVYRIIDPPTPDVKLAKTMAQKLGLIGEMYVPPSNMYGMQVYDVIDYPERMQYFDHGLVYIADLTRYEDHHGTPLSFEQQAAISESFLKSHGLLDFSYRIEAGRQNTTDVVFTPLLEGYALLDSDPFFPRISVSLNTDGSIRKVEYKRVNMETVGSYPLRSASDAWQALLTGKLGGRFGYQVVQAPAAVPPMEWRRQYQPGQHVDLYGGVDIYQSVDTGTASLVAMEGLLLNGDLKGLDMHQGSVHVWGLVKSGARGNPELNLEGWEPFEGIWDEEFYGTLEKDGENMLLVQTDGKRLILLDPPQDLPIGEIAYVSGKVVENRGKVEWRSISAGMRICESFSSSYQYSYISAGGNGGGGGGGGGGGMGAPQDLCTRYGNVNASSISGGYDNLLSPEGGPEPTPTPVPAPYRAGARIEGLKGELNGNLLVHTDGSKTPQFSLQVIPEENGSLPWNADLLGNITGMEKLLRLNIRVWGVYEPQANGRTAIIVERYEAANPLEHVQAWMGSTDVIDVAGRKVLRFTATDGKQYLLESYLNIPQEIVLGNAEVMDQIILEGVLHQPEKTFGGYPLIRDLMITSPAPDSSLHNYEITSNLLYETSEAMQSGLADLISGPVTVEKAELVYQTMGVVSADLAPDHPARYIQPLWSFSGHMQDGREFNLLVQAVQDKFLK